MPLQKTTNILLTLLLSAVPAIAQTPAVTLPTNYNLTYNYTPTNLNQISTSGHISSGQMVCARNINDFQEGYANFQNSLVPFGIANYDGVPCLQISAIGSGQSWQSGLISTLAPNGSGFAAPTDAYWETEVYMPTGGTGTWPIMELYNTSANPGTAPFFNYTDDGTGYWMQTLSWITAETDGFNVPGLIAGAQNQQTIQGLLTGWHVYSMWVTADTTALGNAGIYYFVDGVQTVYIPAPGEPGSNWSSAYLSTWQSPAGMDICNGIGPNNSNPTTNLSSPQNMYIAYIRCWTPGSSTSPTPTPSATPAPSPSPSATPTPSPTPHRHHRH